MVTFDKELVEEAKGIVSLAVLQEPLMELACGVPCPACSGEEGFARITDAELAKVSKEAASTVFRLLWLRDHDPESYRREISSARAHEGAGYLEDGGLS